MNAIVVQPAWTLELDKACRREFRAALRRNLKSAKRSRRHLSKWHVLWIVFTTTLKLWMRATPQSKEEMRKMY